jgi:hypothetical protein
MAVHASDEGVALGHAIFSLIEPHPGHELAWNRYYERDHLIAAGSCAPWTFSTQRWIATRRHKTARYPGTNVIASPPEKGTFMAAMWIQKGRFDDQQTWVAEQMKVLGDRGRTFDHRDVLTTTGYDFLGAAARDHDGVPPELALEHRYPGIVLAWVERAPDLSLGDLRDALLGELLPRFLRGSATSQALCFTPLPKADWWPKAAPEVPGVGDRVLVAGFVECDPLDVWKEHYETFGTIVEASGGARLLFVAPFVPGVPGVDPDLGEL